MDVTSNLRDMITPTERRTDPAMPAQGERATDPATGVTITVDRSTRMPNGKVAAFGLDDNGEPQRIYL